MYSRKMRIADDEIPALLFFSDSIEKAGGRGTVLFYHGLVSSKEANAKELESIARKGFLAIGIDNVEHGERHHGESRKQDDDFMAYFLDLVIRTVDEVPGIIDFLIESGFSDPEKFGISGISMGGYITYGAVALESRIRVAAPILGSPEWKHPQSPHLSPGKFYPRPILSQNAGSDESVPPRFARRFHERLQPYYSGSEERLRYVEFPGEPHIMSEQAWGRLWENTLEWLERWL